MTRGIDPQELSPEERSKAVPDGQAEHNLYRCVLPSLYESWVERPELVTKSKDRTDFLNIADLKASASRADPCGIRPQFNGAG